MTLLSKRDAEEGAFADAQERALESQNAQSF